MRILLTADTVGGVGAFAHELAQGLAALGHVVEVAAIGSAAWDYRLEWMDCGDDAVGLAQLHADCQAARRQLAEHARNFGAEVLHTNHFAYVGAVPGTATVLGVHSDVVSWWRAVRGLRPPNTAFQRWYRRLATAALAQAQRVVAPTQSAAGDLALSCGWTGPVKVIANGCDPQLFRPGPKSARAIAAGRANDPAKQLGWLRELGVEVLDGTRPRTEVARAFSTASVFVSASLYEPFGLAALEAALSGCRLLLNDLPSQREVWASAATYYTSRQRGDLSRRLHEMLALPLPGADAVARQRALGRYTQVAMAAAYVRVYAGVLRRQRSRQPGPRRFPSDGEVPVRPKENSPCFTT